MTVLRLGSTGASVREVQTALARLGTDAGPVDGRFGPATARAVERFQASLALSADGVVGARTWQALRLAQDSVRVNARFDVLAKEGLARLGASDISSSLEGRAYADGGTWSRTFERREDGVTTLGRATLQGEGPAMRFRLELERPSVSGTDRAVADFADGRWTVTKRLLPHLLDGKGEALLRQEVTALGTAAAKAAFPTATAVEVRFGKETLERAALVEGVVHGATVHALVDGVRRTCALTVAFDPDGSVRGAGATVEALEPEDAPSAHVEWSRGGWTVRPFSFL